MKSKLNIIGRVGRDPEMKFTPSGTGVCKFSVATDRSYTNNGEKVKETTWFQVTAWGKLAEVCNEYVKKGMLVDIEGRLEPDKATGGPRIWEKDGVAKSSFEVTANEITFLSKQEPAKSSAAIDEEPF